MNNVCQRTVAFDKMKERILNDVPPGFENLYEPPVKEKKRRIRKYKMNWPQFLIMCAAWAIALFIFFKLALT